MTTKLTTALLSIICVAALVSTATADIMVYGDYPGVIPGQVDFLAVTEESVTDDLPLFGEPTRLGDSLLFFPLSFGSSAADGSSDTTAGTLTMRIRADEDMYLGRITIEELGDYHLTGVGTPDTSASVEGGLTITDLSPGTHGDIFDNMIVVSPPPYALPGDYYGTYSGSVLIDLSATGITEIALEFENTLGTTSEEGTTAYIQKKSIEGLAISIETIIPEPATIGLLAVGAVGLLISRRRK